MRFSVRVGGMMFAAWSVCAAAAEGYTVLSSDSVRFWVTDAPWADLHYFIPGQTAIQRSVRMRRDGDRHSYVVSGIPQGALLQFYFTVGLRPGGARDTVWEQFTCCGQGGYSSRDSSTSSSDRARRGDG